MQWRVDHTQAPQSKWGLQHYGAIVNHRAFFEHHLPAWLLSRPSASLRPPGLPRGWHVFIPWRPPSFAIPTASPTVTHTGLPKALLGNATSCTVLHGLCTLTPCENSNGAALYAHFVQLCSSCLFSSSNCQQRFVLHEVMIHKRSAFSFFH